MLKKIKKYYWQLLKTRKKMQYQLLRKNSPKIFCVGFNKTGTTTLEATLKEFGYFMGDQVKGELLIKD